MQLLHVAQDAFSRWGKPDGAVVTSSDEVVLAA